MNRLHASTIKMTVTLIAMLLFMLMFLSSFNSHNHADAKLQAAVVSAVNEYFSRNGVFPENLRILIDAGVLANHPALESTGSRDVRVRYRTADCGKHFIITFCEPLGGASIGPDDYLYTSWMSTDPRWVQSDGAPSLQCEVARYYGIEYQSSGSSASLLRAVYYFLMSGRTQGTHGFVYSSDFDRIVAIPKSRVHIAGLHPDITEWLLLASSDMQTMVVFPFINQADKVRSINICDVFYKTNKKAGWERMVDNYCECPVR